MTELSDKVVTSPNKPKNFFFHEMFDPKYAWMLMAADQHLPILIDQNGEQNCPFPNE